MEERMVDEFHLFYVIAKKPFIDIFQVLRIGFSGQLKSPQTTIKQFTLSEISAFRPIPNHFKIQPRSLGLFIGLFIGTLVSLHLSLAATWRGNV